MYANGSQSEPQHLNQPMSRIYGLKNLYTATIRLLAAYYLDDRKLYFLCTVTYIGPLAHYGTELGIWKTVGWREGRAALITPAIGLVWLWLRWGDFRE